MLGRQVLFNSHLSFLTVHFFFFLTLFLSGFQIPREGTDSCILTPCTYPLPCSPLLSTFICAWEQQLRRTAGTVWVAQTHCHDSFCFFLHSWGICVYNEQTTQKCLPVKAECFLMSVFSQCCF